MHCCRRASHPLSYILVNVTGETNKGLGWWAGLYSHPQALKACWFWKKKTTKPNTNKQNKKKQHEIAFQIFQQSSVVTGDTHPRETVPVDGKSHASKNWYSPKCHDQKQYATK